MKKKFYLSILAVVVAAVGLLSVKAYADNPRSDSFEEECSGGSIACVWMQGSKCTYRYVADGHSCWMCLDDHIEEILN